MTLSWFTRSLDSETSSVSPNSFCSTNILVLSQTCIRPPLLGPLKNDHLGQVVFIPTVNVS